MLIPSADLAGNRDPILLVPYMWIGDFVRCHSVVKVLQGRWPDRPIDVLATSLCAPLVDYMPGLRQAVVCDLPRDRLALGAHLALARRLRLEGYATALVMPRTFKSALAPFLAGIPERVGFFGEMRIGLLTDWRRGERALPRMIDRCAALALPAGTDYPAQWPLPQLVVPAAELAHWRSLQGVDSTTRAVAIAPGAVGPSKRWPGFAALAARLVADGLTVWVLGGPNERPLAAQIVEAGGPRVRDLTGPDLRQAILALAAATATVSNDSGLLHVAAALGTPTIGVFGPTSPWHWAPLNPLAGIIRSPLELACRPCHRPTCAIGHHRCMRELSEVPVHAAVRACLRKPR
jgi:lipopolysaccharide heptosyltransferase II